MKKFIYKIVLISSIVLIIFSAMNITYIYSDYFKSKIMNWTRFKNVPHELDIVNTGTSHGSAGLNYSQVQNYNCWKFSVSSQTFYYDLKILQQYKAHLKEGGYVIIPVSYLSFIKIDEDLKKKQGLRYYRILNPTHIDDFSLSNYILYKIFPILVSDKELVTALKSTYGAIPSQPKVLADYTKKQLLASQEYNKETYFNLYEFDPVQLEDLYELIEFTLEINMTPVLVTIPVADTYTELCTEEIINDFTSSMVLVKEKYNVEYYNYGSHPNYETNYELFKNSSHMNQIGAIKFTDELLTHLGITSP